MTLEEDLISSAGVILAAEEMVEADFVQTGRRGVCSKVTPDADLQLVCAKDGRSCVPPDDLADPKLELFIAWVIGLLLWRNRVHVIGLYKRRQTDLALASTEQNSVQKMAGSGFAVVLDDVAQGLEPLCGLVRIRIWKLIPEYVVRHYEITSVPASEPLV